MLDFLKNYKSTTADWGSESRLCPTKSNLLNGMAMFMTGLMRMESLYLKDEDNGRSI
jgi:hypothetical protein